MLFCEGAFITIAAILGIIVLIKMLRWLFGKKKGHEKTELQKEAGESQLQMKEKAESHVKKEEKAESKQKRYDEELEESDSSTNECELHTKPRKRPGPKQRVW